MAHYSSLPATWLAGMGGAMKMIELFAVQDTVVTALGRVDILTGGWGRFVWYVERKDEDGVIENIIVASFVMAFDTIPAVRQVIDEARARMPAPPSAGVH